MGHAAARRDGSGVDGIMSDVPFDPTRLQRLLPISVWLRGYRGDWLRAHLVAGLT